MNRPNCNSLLIIRYPPEQIEALYQIIVDCGEDMRKRFGLTHWAPPYPIEKMRHNAEEIKVYGVHQLGKGKNNLVGTFTAGTHGWKYEKSLWKNAKHKPLYLGKLAVRPQYQGSGIGRWCVQKVEQLAHYWGCQVVRFDAIAKHKKLIQFYRNIGYIQRGTRPVIDWYGIEWDVIYFEKIITA